MRAFAAVFGRELVERRLSLLAALILGLLPLAAPLLPGSSHHEPGALRQTAWLALLLLAGLGWPLALGASLVSRDLAARRLGFYFARPVPAASLWLGKLAAALVLFTTGLGLIALPSLLSDGQLLHAVFEGLVGEGHRAVPLLAYPESGAVTIMTPSGTDWTPATRLLAILVAMTFAVTAAHAASALLRARSPWLLLDVVLAALSVAGVFWVRGLLLGHQAYGPLLIFERLLAVAATGVLVVAGYRQLRDGRVEMGRSRHVLAATLWPGLFAAVLLGAAYAQWAVTPPFSALRASQQISAAPDGRHVAVAGPVAGRAGHGATFLVDLETGATEHLGPQVLTASYLRFSPSGARAVWPRCRRLAITDCTLWTSDLRSGTAPRPTGIDFSPWTGARFDLSTTGDLVVVVDWREARVHSVHSGALIGAIRLEQVQDARFLDAQHLLVASGGAGELTRLSIWDLESRQIEDLVTLEGEWIREQALDTGRGLLLFNALIPRRHELRDLETGDLLFDATPLVLEHGNLQGARFLAGGRLVLALGEDDGTRITFFVIDPQRPGDFQRLEVPGAQSLVLGPETADGRLLVGRKDAEPPPYAPFLAALGLEARPGWSTWALELGSDGENAAPRLRPLAGGVAPLEGDLFLARGRAVVRWNPGTEEAELVLPAPGS